MNENETLYEILRSYRNGLFDAFDHYYSNEKIQQMAESRPLTENEFLSLIPDEPDKDQFGCYGFKFLQLIVILSDSENDSTTTTSKAKIAIEKIETALHEETLKVLQSEYGEQWWYDGVPETIRIKAAEMHEMRGGRVKKEDCLMLINIKTILLSNWRLFSVKFDPNSTGRRDFESRFNSLNDIRNRLSHPIRLRREPIDDSELEELRSWMQLLT
jgi:hypothetical protein